jgi:hypothetical protein
MGLDGLFREEEPLTDFAVYEPVRDELEDLDLAGGRLLFQLTQNGRRRERDHGPRALRVPTCRSRLESTAVVAVSVQDLLTLRGVHAMRIGGLRIAL